MFVILKLCCFDCKKFLDYYIIDSDYRSFIISLEDYRDFTFFVIDLNYGESIYLDGVDL